MMTTATQFRINAKFDTYIVETLDNNNVWVLAEPGACEFATRDEAQSYIDSWDNAEQLEDVL